MKSFFASALVITSLLSFTAHAQQSDKWTTKDDLFVIEGTKLVIECSDLASYKDEYITDQIIIRNDTLIFRSSEDPDRIVVLPPLAGCTVNALASTGS